MAAGDLVDIYLSTGIPTSPFVASYTPPIGVTVSLQFAWFVDIINGNEFFDTSPMGQLVITRNGLTTRMPRTITRTGLAGIFLTHGDAISVSEGSCVILATEGISGFVGGGGGGGEYKVARRVITPAELNNIAVTRVEIVPAPDATKALVIDRIIYYREAGTGELVQNRSGSSNILRELYFLYTTEMAGVYTTFPKTVPEIDNYATSALLSDNAYVYSTYFRGIAPVGVGIVMATTRASQNLAITGSLTVEVIYRELDTVVV